MNRFSYKKECEHINLYFLYSNPGDRIQIGEHRGDVVDLRIFQFSLLEIGNWVDADQSTGRIIHIPNSIVFNETLANYNTGFDHIWNEIPVLITFESNWEKAKEILQTIMEQNSSRLSNSAEKEIKEASKKYLIYYSKLTPVVFTDVKDSGVLLTIRYVCSPKQRRKTSREIWEAILKAFSKTNDIDLAYPTQRFYRHLKDK
jgi:small-conductance mechanosensitive channel